MEKITAPLNIIANYIMKNQIPKLEALIIKNNTSILANNLEINQRDVVIQTVEDYQKVRENIHLRYFSEMN